MIAPAGGFAEAGLASIFGSDFIKTSKGSPSPWTQPGRLVPDRVRHAIIAGAAVGGVVFCGLSFAIVWPFRHALYRRFVGDLVQHSEMDGKGRSMFELPDKGAWELPGTSPAELWGPTSTVTDVETDNFKHETRSDRELGWRGNIECVGDLAKEEYVIDKRDGKSIMSKHAQVTCKELD